MSTDTESIVHSIGNADGTDPGFEAMSSDNAEPGTHDLLAAYRAVRGLTEQLASPLSAEDQTVQSMPDVSPTKWHRAHTTWFFETFVLERSCGSYDAVDPRYRELFNSYYEGIGPQFTRSHRGLVSRPGVAEIGEYRRTVDARMHDLFARLAHVERVGELERIVTLGLHHEQQHQELLLMDIEHVLSINPLEPVYRAPTVDRPDDVRPLGWTSGEGGLVDIGHDVADDGFAFDNESPRHRTYLEPFELADRLVTNGEWLAFMDDGGYERPELWLSDGWHTVREQGWEAPLYWRRRGGTWHAHSLAGTHPIEPVAPVAHVSHYEADAYARWAGARLPTEFEWEHAAATAPSIAPRPFDVGMLGPVSPADSADEPRGLHGLHGECWQWTSSAYLPYPGFVPAPGAVGEYNGKFMSGQMVLRGSSAYTPPGHARDTYRNFFPPHARWMLSGVRLARGAPR